MKTTYQNQADSYLRSQSLGFAHFVLLLSLTPFIFNLSLFKIGHQNFVASEYLIDPLRFEGLNYAQLNAGELEKPIPPKVDIDSTLRHTVFVIFNISPEQFCSNLDARNTNFFFLVFRPPELVQPCAQYRRSLQIYIEQLKQYNQAINAEQLDKKKLVAQANEFLSQAQEKAIKPPAQQATVISRSQGYFETLFAQFELDTSSEDKLTPAGLVVLLTWLLASLFLIPALFVCLREKAWFLAIFGLCPPAYNYLVYLLALFLDDPTLGFYQIELPLLAQLSLLVFLLSGKVRSRSFAGFSIVVLALIAITLSDYGSYVAGLLGQALTPVRQSAYHSAFVVHIIPMLMFIIVAVIGRLFVKGARQNWGLIKDLGWSRTTIAIARSVYAWIPMGALCLPFFWLTQHYIPKTITNNLHEQGIMQFAYSPKQTVLDNSLVSTAHRVDDINFVWHLSIEEQKANLNSNNEKFQKADFTRIVARRFDQSVPKSLAFKESRSGAPLIGWAVDIANNEMKDSIQSAYSKLRSDLKKGLTDLVDDQQTSIKELARSNLAKAMRELEKMRVAGQKKIQLANAITQAGIFNSFAFLYAYHQLAMLLFYYVCVKSLLYVFARVSVNQKTGISVTLGDCISEEQSLTEDFNNLRRTASDELDKHAPSIISHGSEIKFSGPAGTTIYLSRKFQCRGKAPKLRFIQPFSAPFARMFNGAYGMNELNLTNADTDVGCSSTQGIEYFEWDLKDNERVVFDFKNFVGISKSVSLSTLVSPRISSFLIGNIIYSQAKGPGKLFLMAKGRAQVCSGDVQVGSLPPQRMLAMDVNTKLFVESELDLLNVYCSDAYIKPVQGTMIIDVDTQTGSKSGLGTFLRHFILPG
ncbi:hypothetical protein PN836_009560 [Ningiella sp. W23]|uniref:hypothetical protein n=1 Tax=Ningiella sp. W23 TaxID=3023715 RepID=UPI00375813D5